MLAAGSELVVLVYAKLSKQGSQLKTHIAKQVLLSRRANRLISAETCQHELGMKSLLMFMRGIHLECRHSHAAG